MVATEEMSATIIKRLFPSLGTHLRKGDCGKIGVIGGSPEYTGAPYFAAITPLKIGADLSFVYCPPAAAPVIKGYSPELIVYPHTEFALNQHSLAKLDAVLFGPGLGREAHTLNLLKDMLNFVRNTPKICMVIDADGLFYLKDCIGLLKGFKNNLVITPNHREFARLFNYVFPDQKVAERGIEEQKAQTSQLANHLELSIVRKGESDIITDGNLVIVSDAVTSPRRCGGQGDILSGATALFAYWSKKIADAEQYSPENLLKGAEAASHLLRKASLATFKKTGRPMNATDIIAEIPIVVNEIDAIPKIMTE